MKILGPEEIISAGDLPPEVVEVPEWGGAVRIRGLTAAERVALADEIVGNDGKPARDFQARLVAQVLCDENGRGICTREQLAKKSGAVIERLFLVAQRLSGLGEDAVKTTAGKSDAAPTSSSSSG